MGLDELLVAWKREAWVWLASWGMRLKVTCRQSSRCVFRKCLALEWRSCFFRRRQLSRVARTEEKTGGAPLVW